MLLAPTKYVGGLIFLLSKDWYSYPKIPDELIFDEFNNCSNAFTHLIPRTERYNRKQINSFYESNIQVINRMFFVIERHKDSKYYHTHFLLKTPSIKELNKSTKSYRRFIDIDLKIIDENLLESLV